MGHRPRAHPPKPRPTRRGCTCSHFRPGPSVPQVACGAAGFAANGWRREYGWGVASATWCGGERHACEASFQQARRLISRVLQVVDYLSLLVSGCFGVRVPGNGGQMSRCWGADGAEEKEVAWDHVPAPVLQSVARYRSVESRCVCGNEACCPSAVTMSLRCLVKTSASSSFEFGRAPVERTPVRQCSWFSKAGQTCAKFT